MQLIEGILFGGGGIAGALDSLSASLPAAVHSLSESTFVFAYQIQGILVLFVLATTWLWAAQCRVRESRRIIESNKRGHHLAFVEPDLSRLSGEAQERLPKVSVVLAVKGSVGEAGMDNWRSQLVTLYGGEMEYIFCVESKDDPAYEAVKSLQREMKGVEDVRLVVAGLASNCSQQIHNQLAAARVACPRSKYLLLLDDDIQCHPGTVGALVKAMESRHDVFCCSGYSFDIPSSPSLAAYMAMAYRLPLQVGMATGGRGMCLWGGCIMIRVEDLRTDRFGLWTALQRNGYSNDLILTAIAANHGCTMWCPPSAIFPGRMSGDWTFRRYWNYARRQTYALTTWCSPFAFRVNMFGLAWYGYSAFCVTAPLLPSLALIVQFLCALASGEAALADVLDTPSLAAACIVWLLVGLSCLSGIRLFHAVVTLCNLLSPEKPPIRLGSISVPLGVLGMIINLSLVPIISVYTLMQPAISWAGITYVRRRGLIHKVIHPQTAQLAAATGVKASRPSLAAVAPLPSPEEIAIYLAAAKGGSGARECGGGGVCGADVMTVGELSLSELEERYWDGKMAKQQQQQQQQQQQHQQQQQQQQQQSSDWVFLSSSGSWSQAWAVRVEALCRRIPIIGRSLSQKKERSC